MSFVVVTLAGAATHAQETSISEDDIKQALAQGEYPWYDAATDSYRAVTPPQIDLPPTPGLELLGKTIVFLILAGAVAALVYLLFRFWQRYLGMADMEIPRVSPARQVSRTGSLPRGVETDVDDPWAAARDARDRGDYAAAVVLLFAHQLLTIDRLGLARLLPGRTGRQIVRAVSDVFARSKLDATLRLFESVYYGHEPPTEAEFARVWAEAEAFESWRAERSPT